MTKAQLSKLPLSDFAKHRAAFITKMANNTIAIFPAASELTRSNDTEFAFCQNKNFYYLTGFNEPDALLVLVKNEQGEARSILFSLPKDPLHEIWQGRRIGQIKAVEDYGLDKCFEVKDIDALLPDYLNGKSQVFFSFSDLAFAHHTLSAQVFIWLKQVKSRSRQGVQTPQCLMDSDPIVEELRLIKSDNELALMRQANHISGLAHQRAMQKCQVGKFEYQIEAEILHEFAKHGARHPAYASIVAGGDNANILHYTANSDALNNNELLLIDAGAELNGYAADITRTFPINGKFTPAQATLYQLVLDAKNLAINAIKPGMTFAKLNILTNAFLTQGLLDLGIFHGDINELITDKKIKQYFIHGLGHWLGLDVHDVGDYQSNEKREQTRVFEPGMVMTIEPGLYIPLDDLSVEQKWRGIGIRIEDNIAVTATGFENLTANSPQTIAEIETLMAKS
ncbi:Xaa-Pro aminopeptidase [Colwellia echini]|uniref:Xaa-Pro aminopeptidase n=1 Tax=Colwellia echini TaxID=1982103 RepID=A0ABY3MVK9_9GAMM|nr:Xaa-Pro aminopeptidase [Colwellia echini]TYK65171.1 Xaa-Pro aminopeptidase [Colwellia echini]